MGVIAKIKAALASGSDVNNYNYLALGLVAMLNHIKDFMYWTHIDPQYYENIYLRGFGVVVCILFLSIFLWPPEFKRFKRCIWLFAIAYNLPFFFVTQLIKNNF